MFAVEGERYAVAASAVREVVRAVAVRRLPGAPAAVEGVVDVRGELVPVYDLRARFGLPRRDVHPSEHFVVATAGDRPAAVRADRVEGLASVADAAADASLSSSPYVTGAARLPDGMALIHDLRAFLATDEADVLDAALARAAAGAER